MAVHRSSTPSPDDAIVSTMGGRQSPSWVRSSMSSRSRRVSRAPGRSALLMTNRSAISRRPALFAWMASPQPGFTTTIVVSVAAATATSCWPTPTVSSSTTGTPTADRTRTASGTATARPPRWPRVAIERMKTLSSRAWFCIRTRSPRMAPPENGDDGSMASTATWSLPSRPRRPRPVDQLVGEGGLAGPRRPGDPHGVGLSGRPVGDAGHRPGTVAAAFDQGQQPGQRDPVARTGGLEQRRRIGTSAGGHGGRSVSGDGGVVRPG